MSEHRCLGCGSIGDERLKQAFANDYEYVFRESRSTTALLMRVDCHNAAIDKKTFASAVFCPTRNIKDYGYYRITEWWVSISGRLERWSIGPGGFFREPSLLKCFKHGEETE